MALIDQPYIPFFVDDWMGNLKLKECSPGAHGIMINIMCIMHKGEVYGKISLKQKYKQTPKQILNFASQLAKQTCFEVAQIIPYLEELLHEKVLKIEDDFLVCNRMVNDAKKSAGKASNGSKGGKKTQAKNKKFASNFAKAKIQANTGIGIESENGVENDSLNNNKGTVLKMDFEIETALTFEAFWDLYDKKVSRDKCEKAFKAIGEGDRQKIAEHIPKYRLAQPNKKYRKDPYSFLFNKSWNDEIITDNAAISTSPTGGNTKLGTSDARVNALSKW